MKDEKNQIIISAHGPLLTCKHMVKQTSVYMQYRIALDSISVEDTRHNFSKSQNFMVLEKD